MDQSVLTVIISSTTSAIVGIVTILINSSKSKKNSIALEAFKFQLEEQKSAKLKLVKEYEDALTRTYGILRNIQQIKDGITEIRMLIHEDVIPNLHTLEELRRKIFSFSEVYSATYADIDPAEQILVHDLKGTLIQLSNTILRILEPELNKPLDKTRFLHVLQAIYDKIGRVQQTFLLQKVNLHTLIEQHDD